MDQIKKNQRILDISPLISADTPVWPGDVSLTQTWQCRIADGSNIDLSSVQTTVHIGAHADAPSHFHKDGATIDEVDLDAYCGLCQVIEIPTHAAITWAAVESKLKSNIERVLFKTSSFVHNKPFNEVFAYFDPALIHALGVRGVKLIGIDTPSVDVFDSKDLLAHQELYRWSIRNLEGLDLSQVTEGEYELIALPLRLKGFDGSPVRAILRQIDQ